VTGVDVAALRKLHEAATPGPWRWDDRLTRAKHLQSWLTNRAAGGYGQDVLPTGMPDVYPSKADADLITALRNAAPALLDAAEALERVGEAIKDTCWKATPYGITQDGDIHAYIVPKGTMHRLIGAAQSAGISAVFRNIGASEGTS
jgi:hypothetical protein